MELQVAVRDAARRLPIAAVRLAGVPGSGLPLSTAETDQVAGMLDAMHAAFMEDGSLADDLLSDEAVRLALLRLLDFGRKLLRMDTLQCCSRALSQGTADLQATGQAPGVPAEADPAAEARPAAEAGPAAVQGQFPASLLINMCPLVESLQILTFAPVKGVKVLAHAARARWPEQLQRQQQVYGCELTAALRDSCVLEHCARWALHAQLAGAARRVPEVLAMNVVSNVSWTLWYADILAIQLQGHPAAPALREALSGPCVRHLALSLGLAALCAADGGPSHGLPPELLLHLPILGRDGADLRGTHGRQRLGGSVLLCMLRVLKDSTAASATPPRDWRSVELVLDTTEVLSVALPALEQYRRLVCGRQADPEALAEAEAAWWRLGVDVATHCLRWGSSKELAELADLLRLGWGPLPAGHVPTGLLPPPAPLPVAAALAGGLLPLWERLLRRAGREPLSPEASLLTCMLEKVGEAEGLCDILACCELHEGAALVATWGKLLRTVAVPQLLSSLDAGGVGGAGGAALALAQAEFTGRLLDSLRCRLTLASSGGGAAAAAGTEAVAPQVQLARLASYAVREWLPALACFAQEALRAVHRLALAAPTANSMAAQYAVSIARALMADSMAAQYAVSIARALMADSMAAQYAVSIARALMADSMAAQYAVSIARAVVRWLPVLVAAAGGAAATQPAAEAAGSGWRQLLLREVGAVTLLGAACQVLLQYLNPGKDASSQESWDPFIASCCLVAAACPGEVRQAVLAAAAEAGASAGSGSGGRRGATAGGGRRRGMSGPSAEPGPSRAAAPPPPGWSPQLLQLMAVELRSGRGEGLEILAAAASALARQAEHWLAGGGEDGTELVGVLGRHPATNAAARALVSSPSEARALLRTCAHPACDNLAGDSEAEVPLRACGRCGGAWYCRRECSVAHWRSGHREACVGRGEAAVMGTAGPGEAMPGSSMP
ncbi:hypothetical protein TSOC_012243 [Tetrabaena socialis]|uniref:phytol kinase n=1 Tax=Tetrabaena socialis TaxID=47790 RepID=A0A2J7ZNK6_9CHLO|nr:hypothetical protein TSOC_012243 [Tetrabaena socialis]|eukprot:PNH01847.1 hypothetical protein TSOC_012243 [Tetrabaena socialis]